MLSKYGSEFHEIEEIGSGGFSTVYKVKSLKDGKLYAIKKVSFEIQRIETVMKETKFLQTIKSDFVVNYIDSWMEKNYYINKNVEEQYHHNEFLYSPTKPHLLHIQMELCTITLRDIIINYGYKGQMEVTPENYASACEILMQILNGINYLHSHNPQIIHRDLKPENILIIQTKDQIKVKLSDFGLSAFHEFSDQSHTKYIGTRGYRAPELNYTTKYCAAVDMYSLGNIIQDLFNINFNRDFIKLEDELLNKKYKVLIKTCVNCLAPSTDIRPKCIDFIKNSSLWFYELTEKINFEELIKEIKSSLTVVNPSNFFSYTIEQNKYRALEIDGNLYRRYKSNFKDICILGSGSYGQVWKTSDIKQSESYYAIKKIKVLTNDFDKLEKYVKREVKILSKLNEKYIVKYIDSWIDENYYVEKPKSLYPNLMHIQMELCLITLQDITFELINPKQIHKNSKISAIKNSRKLFETLYDKDTNFLNCVGYYIATELLKEILECVDYLHNCEPVVLHRDLKPSNILITYNGTERFVKLADFGLATLHEYAEQSHTVGVGTYTCPDVKYGNYNAKSDIYVLHYVVSELFNINVNSEITTKKPLRKKYAAIQNLLIEMSTSVSKRRPDCSEILRKKNAWLLTYRKAEKYFNSSLLQKFDHKTDLLDSFVQLFIQTKSNYELSKRDKSYGIWNRLKSLF